ncbi:MAG: nucleotidyl transferase AbiEii/AbiGii toxin family protein [Candidatus Omnitrophota bacterium]
MKKEEYIRNEQEKITKAVTDKYKEYYLTGGTALSFYFNHRFSVDLDFFTQKYKKDLPGKIVNFISEYTGYKFTLEAEQKDPELIPMKVYSFTLKKGELLKIDFVQDYEKNINKVKDGLHSVEDIYCRKMIAAMGVQKKESITGELIPSGRQSVKDLFDLYYLSKNYKALSAFFQEYFSVADSERLIIWYRRFNRMDLKLELLDLVPGVDTAAVIKYMDDEILKNLVDKFIM